MTADINAGYDAILKSHAKELVKQFITYDGLDRPEFVYTAYVDTPNNGPCEVTQYVYVGNTSRVEKRRETIGVWLDSYNI